MENKVIAREYIENILNELKKQYQIELEENSTKAFILKCQIDIVEKILEGKCKNIGV